jgi:uncharacterized phiE125 gp8 family phage protein
MLLRQITPPAAPFVTLPEAKAHLRIFHSDEDVYIQALVDAAVGHLDGAQGILGRCVSEQDWEMTIDRFPCEDAWGRVQAINLPLPPTISVASVKYDDASHIEQTLTGTRLIGAASAGGAFILPAFNTRWPSTDLRQPASVRVTFTAGYATTPPGIKWAVLLIVSHLYEHREENVDTGAKFGLLELPFGVKALLAPHMWR